MRLNLGCGKVLFPWTPEKEATRHPALVVPPSAFEADWLNVDGLALAGVDEVVDLFAYPWPWADNSVDEIWASHLVEHIPHAPRVIADMYGEDKARWGELEPLEGFYAFFAECHRVLKPNGTIGIVAPYGKSDGALYDPQHTRFITEQTFHYLGNGGGNSPTYDYSLPFNFAVEGEIMFGIHPMWQGKPTEEIHQAMTMFWNVATTIQVTLKALK